MDLDRLTRQTGAWLKNEGPEVDIVVSSRMRLARNLEAYPFPSRFTPEQRREIAEYLREVLCNFDEGPRLTWFALDELSDVDRQVLLERHLISKEHAEGEGVRGVAVSDDESIAIMVNEEDHLRMQVFHSGLRLAEAWQIINRLDDAVSQRVQYAFSPEFGYLSACPTNVGTGLRASVMLHLPALGLTGQVEAFFRSVNRINLAVRGLYGEGTEATGNLFQVSNQVSLGKSEEEIIENLSSAVPQIVLYERKAREHIMERRREQVEDRIWRALAMLQSARVMTSGETLELLSHVRLGINLGLLPDVDIGVINQLFVQTLPGHLQKLNGKVLGPDDRDVFRARFIRDALRNG